MRLGKLSTFCQQLKLQAWDIILFIYLSAVRCLTVPARMIPFSGSIIHLWTSCGESGRERRTATSPASFLGKTWMHMSTSITRPSHLPPSLLATGEYQDNNGLIPCGLGTFAFKISATRYLHSIPVLFFTNKYLIVRTVIQRVQPLRSSAPYRVHDHSLLDCTYKSDERGLRTGRTIEMSNDGTHGCLGANKSPAKPHV